ncbi:uncharacterized protein N7483_005525 [Penicillium malachiteum]|uniref:uncharacterized protein n=1 Tax=Penicillium malachiteum TaxID=1324776 RepID=UPI0025484B2D|nr:uncharacterized protein N7483_005525 [Penicillium malachiteum]KAJ5731017.1 hypothetical protein N7483_005525 [Penicillium malachiteum]
MSADPPRRRRSSISTHFQRVFHVDSAEKKRQSRGQDSSQDPSRLSWTPSDGHDPKLEATAAHSGPEETGVSSFNFSSNSHIPSLDTPESSPSVLQVVPSDEKSISQPMAKVNNPNTDRSNICSSPTWGKENSRKERRATKRLEAERKELEKRLLHLEECQSRVDNGIFDRASRRLSKKHTQGSSSRSSSTGSSRLRSSSITAFFTGSRRASRANSINEDDASTQPAGPPGPPSVPLALSERFGANVSRELADRHGTTLMPTSLTQPPSSQSQLSHTPHQLPRSLHTTPKSDDLRENWKTAQEWKKNNDNHGMSTELLARRLESLTGGRSQQHNVELVDTNPMSDLKSLKAMESFAEAPSTGTTIDRSTGSSTKSPPSASTRITTARQFRELSDSIPETPNGSPSSHSKGSTRSSSSILASMKNGSPKRTSKEASSQPPSRQYISSPLAMHPNTPEQPNRSPNRNFSLPLTHVQVPEPLRIVKPSPPEESQGRNRQSIPSWLKTARDENRRETWGPRSESFDLQKSPLPTLPLKNPGRRSLEEHASKGANNGAPPGFSPLKPSVPPNSQESPLADDKASKEQTTMGLNEGGHDRSPSPHSSDGASSYDTADEEVLDVPKKRPSNVPTRVRDPSPKKPTESTPEIMARSGLPMTPTNFRGNPPLAPSGPLSMLRKKPMQKVKSPRAEDVIAKLFVICCQCKYWHDMPSEMYAKLACPERLPSDSRLVRTFSRRNSVRNAIFASDPNDPRRMPLPRRTHPQNEPPNTRGPAGDGRGAPAPQSPPLYRPQCCWCGHNMSKSCCQGWTALVHMRERYH